MTIPAPTRDMVFTRTFMLHTWNLMARASSTAAVRQSHLEWGEDALRVYFAQTKADQFGTHSREPRHVYANPLQPELCSILALGMFWLCNDNFVDELQLFAGDAQNERLRKILPRALNLPELREEIKDRVTLGTHSFRKGASSYAAYGTTAALTVLFKIAI
ncbi:Hypothetical protein PHPALM_16904 [Phytophthora palmivora]|uniref:Uncharacterized protein n=1 Tax=Phytophthora palmivora TaxID=4796 RepID=A0A2P4XNM0_9STRA|nr:Hypothetical protein PHPALM_16904 [Phytophthora palmivora]